MDNKSSQKQYEQKEKQAERLAEAVEFFRREAGFRRLLELFIKKYYRLGGIKGSAKLSRLTAAEKEALSGIMGRDYRRQNSATISLANFQRALEKTRFAGIEIKDILAGYLGKDLVTRQEEEERYLAEKEAFFQNLYQRYANNYCRSWLIHIQKKGAGTRGIHSAYEQNSRLLYKQINNVLKTLQELCSCRQIENKSEERKNFERLPVFASRISGDPHGFDGNTDQGRFLISALVFIRSQTTENTVRKTSSLSAEETTELLASFGLIRDDLLNFVTCAGILAFRGEERVPVSMWQKAWEDGTVLNVPLREITRLSGLEPATINKKGDAEKAVFVVENSGVFSEILESFQATRLPPLVCTQGQIKLAAFLMLDILAKDNTVIYYSGDFDPEGLQIAQRLLQRYPNQLRLWRYGIAEYNSCISEVVISETRLKKLKSITHPTLIPIKEKMQAVGKAGYQEQLVSLLAGDIGNYIVKGS